MFSKHCWLVSGCLLAQCLGWSSAGNAQEEPSTVLAEEEHLVQQDPDATPAAPETPEGAAVMADDGRTRLGPFVLDADLTVSQGYTDNVYATRNDKVGDGLAIATPNLSLTSEGLPVELELFGSAEIGRYWDERPLDRAETLIVPAPAAQTTAPARARRRAGDPPVVAVPELAASLVAATAERS